MFDSSLKIDFLVFSKIVKTLILERIYSSRKQLKVNYKAKILDSSY